MQFGVKYSGMEQNYYFAIVFIDERGICMAVEKVTKVTENGGGQVMSLVNRNEMKLTGVTDVVEFSDNMIELVTNMGILSVKGEGLKLLSVSTDNQTAGISGRVDSVEYKKQKEAKSFFANLFR